MDATTRFWRKTNRTKTCWLWTGHLNADGYGRIHANGRRPVVHRFSWELSGRSIPDGMQLDHICRVPSCVNPDHLRVVTQYENMQNLSGAQSRNRTGIRGVSWSNEKRKYRVQVSKNHVTHFGGYFTDPQEAAEAARQLRLSMFTHNDADRRG